MSIRYFTFFLLLQLIFFTNCSTEKPARPLPFWEVQDLGKKVSLRGLSVVDESIAWVSGSGGTIARTTDGGRTWRLLESPGSDSLDFRDIEAFDSLRAIVMSAGPGPLSRVYRTEDGGSSWTRTVQNLHSDGFFNGIAFWNERDGLLTGDPVEGALWIMHTHDGGASWQRVPPATLPPVDSLEYGFAASGSHIAVASDSLAWIATGGNVARVFRSTNGGLDWEVSPTPMISGAASTGIFSLAFLDDRRGVAVGGDYQQPNLAKNNLLVTEDGGQHWHLVQPSPMPYRSCVRAVEGNFIAAGPAGSNISYDRGQTWLSIDTTGYHVIGAGKTREAVWAAGANGRVAKIRWE